MNRAICCVPLVIVLGTVGCGEEGSTPVGSTLELGWIEGVIDPAADTVAYRTATLESLLDAAETKTLGLSAVTEDRNGSSGSASAVNSAEFFVECNGTPSCASPFRRPGAVVAGCGGVNSFEMDVTVRSFFPGGLSSAHAEFTELNNVGVDGRANTGDAFEGSDIRPCNSDPVARNLDVAGTPLNNSMGLFRYGQLIANPTAPSSAPALAGDTARWKFRNPGGVIRFKARLVGEPCVGDCTPARHAPQFWQAEGGGGAAVNASAEGNGVIYLGGTFNYVGPRTGSGGALGAVGAGANQGKAILPWPAVEGGDVFAILRDGVGGAYLGGNFTSVGGQTRLGLARVNSNGTVASFESTVVGTVRTLALANGRLITGGLFTSVGGASRSNMAAVDATTGVVDAAWVADTNGEVRASFVFGSDLYIGGAFTSILSTSPPATVVAGRVARLDIDQGDADATFSASVEVADGRVNAISLGAASGGDPNNVQVFLGGTFTTINGSNTGGRGGAALTRQRLAAFTAVNLAVTSFAATINGDVNALATTGNTAYAVGNFTTVNGSSRQRGAAFTDVGTLLAWRPNLNNTAFAIGFDAAQNLAYIGGQFAARTLAVSGTSGSSANWGVLVGANNANLVSASAVHAISLDNTVVRVGGSFRSIGGVSRFGAAALSLSNGEATTWAPNASQLSVSALAVLPAGDAIVGTSQSVFRASQSGAIVWSRATNAPVLALATDASSNVYAGGAFTSVGGQSRVGLAALDGNGSSLAWQANTNVGGSVRALAIFKDELYAGGSFTSIQGNSSISSLAAISNASASAVVRRAWPANGLVLALAPQRDALFVGGAFTTIDGVNRTRFAAIDGTTVTPFAISAGQSINALAAVGGNVHIGGVLVSLSGATCLRACTISANGATFGAFSGGLSGVVNTISIAGPFLFAGGSLVNSSVSGGGLRNGNAVLFAD